jgi:excisionase family DNA binding protein
VDEGFAQGKHLLETEDVAEYLGVKQTTVWRWCREGSLPCLKIGKEWRIRREALEGFLKRSEHPTTLVGQLRSFLEVPDNILGIAQDLDGLHRLDSAFLQVGEAQGGLLVKFYDKEGESLDGLCADLERGGLEVGRLEEEGCLRILTESNPPPGRVDVLRRIVSEEDRGRTVWVSFDWVKEVDLEEALRQQQELNELVEDSRLVVKTAVLEQELDEWPTAGQRQAQTVHSGTVWISESGLALSRITPLPPE